MKTFIYSALVLSVLPITACNGYSPRPLPVSVTSPVSNPPASPTPSPTPNPPANPSPAPPTAVKLANIQASPGWNEWGQYSPDYSDCNAPCPGITWSMTQGIKAPSLSGNATQFEIGGTVSYSDVLFSNPVIGQFSTQNLPDNDHALVPTIHNFIYDTDLYVTDETVTQVLEFDVSLYFNGVGMIWGTQCNYLGDGTWDIWDNVRAHWVSAGVSCSLIDKGWNHLTIQVQREADNSLLYQSLTLNGVTTTLNASYPPGTAAASWWGVTVNYQVDGDSKQSTNTTYLDNLSLTYW